jgi:transcriptional regulator with AAA-type ATPase domain/polyferredoxin
MRLGNKHIPGNYYMAKSTKHIPQRSQGEKELADFLGETGLFKDISREAREKIASRLFVEEIPKGFFITKKDIPVACLYIIKKGHVQAIEVNIEGAEIALADYYAGDYFGEMSLLTGEPSGVTTKAVKDTEVLVLYKMHFDEVLRDNPSINRHFITILSRRIRKVNEQIEEARDKEIAFNRFLRQEQEFRFSRLVGSSKGIRSILDLVAEVSITSRPVLIRGESGTGKELIARTIHYRGERKEEPFIVINCESLEREAWGSELIGYEKGAFATATARRLGYLELADRGTILLKNVDRLPYDTQRLLAGFMESHQFRRLGGTETLSTDVRIIATTEKDLPEMAKRGTFFKELFDKLSGITIEVPRLRERKRDIPELVEHFTEKLARQMGKPVPRVSTDAMNLFLTYDYPGNVEELEGVVERAVALTEGDTVLPDQVYLGLPSLEGRGKYNLLRNRFIWGYFQSSVYPFLVRTFTIIVFGFIFYSLFFGPREGGQNIGNILVLSVWWPSLFLLSFFSARSWCAICPIGAISGVIQRFFSLQRKLPQILKRMELWVPAFLFVIILWVERVTRAREFPLPTALVLLSITLGAIVFSLIFERKVWCRYFCALGNMCGIYAMTSILEVRANTNVCINECKTHECFKGGRTYGCPMFRHPLFLEENQSCRICTYCIKNCPYRSVQLNLRPPGQEIWTQTKPVKGAAFFSLLLASLLFVEILPDLPQFGFFSESPIPLLKINSDLGYTVLLIGIVLLALFLVEFPRLLFYRDGEKTEMSSDHIRYSFAFIPLALCAHFANHLRYVPGGRGLTVQLSRFPFAASAEDPSHILITIDLIWTVQIALAIIGIGWAFYVMYKVYSNQQPTGSQKHSRVFSYYVILLGTYGAIYLWLFSSLRTLI